MVTDISRMHALAGLVMPGHRLAMLRHMFGPDRQALASQFAKRAAVAETLNPSPLAEVVAHGIAIASRLR